MHRSTTMQLLPILAKQKIRKYYSEGTLYRGSQTSIPPYIDKVLTPPETPKVFDDDDVLTPTETPKALENSDSEGLEEIPITPFEGTPERALVFDFDGTLKEEPGDSKQADIEPSYIFLDEFINLLEVSIAHKTLVCMLTSRYRKDDEAAGKHSIEYFLQTIKNKTNKAVNIHYVYYTNGISIEKYEALGDIHKAYLPEMSKKNICMVDNLYDIVSSCLQKGYNAIKAGYTDKQEALNFIPEALRFAKGDTLKPALATLLKPKITISETKSSSLRPFI